MNWGLFRTIIILPGSALVFIPAAILWVTGDTPYTASMPDAALISFWFSLTLICISLVLAFWTARLFLTYGEGTPAPWDPPKKLVVRGPYCYVRNPMITGVMFMLLAEALMFRCRCSREKVIPAIVQMGYQEAMQLVAEQDEISAHCEFCNQAHRFDRVDVAGLFKAHSKAPLMHQ